MNLRATKTIVHGFTKYFWLETCHSFEQIIKLLHAPRRIISDRGKEFADKIHSTKHVKNAIASPRSCGQVERVNHTILEEPKFFLVIWFIKKKHN